MNDNKCNHDNEHGEVIYRTFDVSDDYPSVDVVKVIAELEGKESSELSSMYGTIDHLIENLFSDPPSPDAEAVLEFSYEGYRITLNQDGNATFRKITGGE